ncbi:hypothetical protein HYH03_016427 [Edaphochlamys debaryana]|uniref:Uncharacterized protein n=1 Tax=Edaphochlamys debaryana TaxID=47281 RepID=A0A835XIN7_9CHLO|nr:hypothetical protein HYH03_016427 [Edaphochlamys debaryana]|eukprot:KAG2484773.1 hypothetical protein HYH03_016427 [Edaphochlamys debaryana]
MELARLAGWLAMLLAAVVPVASKCPRPQPHIDEDYLGDIGCVRYIQVCVDQSTLIFFSPAYALDNPHRLPLPVIRLAEHFSWPAPMDTNLDALRLGSKWAHSSALPVRPASAAEPWHDLQEPEFTSCEVPVILTPNWMYNMAEFAANTAGPLRRARLDRVIDGNTTFVLVTPYGLGLRAFHRALLGPYTNRPVLTLAELGQRRPPGAAAAYSSLGRTPSEAAPDAAASAAAPAAAPTTLVSGGALVHPRCFRRVVVCHQLRSAGGQTVPAGQDAAALMLRTAAKAALASTASPASTNAAAATAVANGSVAAGPASSSPAEAGKEAGGGGGGGSGSNPALLPYNPLGFASDMGRFASEQPTSLAALTRSLPIETALAATHAPSTGSASSGSSSGSESDSTAAVSDTEAGITAGDLASTWGSGDGSNANANANATLRVVIESRQGPVRNLQSMQQLLEACARLTAAGPGAFRVGRFASIECRAAAFGGQVTRDARGGTGMATVNRQVTGAEDEALFAANVAAVRSADVLVTVHGAGAANSFFMRPGSALLELRPCHFGTRYRAWPDSYFPRSHQGGGDLVQFYALNVEDDSLCRPGDWQAALLQARAAAGGGVGGAAGGVGGAAGAGGQRKLARAEEGGRAGVLRGLRRGGARLRGLQQTAGESGAGTGGAAAAEAGGVADDAGSYEDDETEDEVEVETGAEGQGSGAVTSVPDAAKGLTQGGSGGHRRRKRRRQRSAHSVHGVHVGVGGGTAKIGSGSTGPSQMVFGMSVMEAAKIVNDAPNIFCRDQHLLLGWAPLEQMLRHVAEHLYDRESYRAVRDAGRTHGFLLPGGLTFERPPPGGGGDVGSKKT